MASLLLLTVICTGGWGGPTPLQTPLHDKGWKEGGGVGRLAGCWRERRGRSAPDEC